VLREYGWIVWRFAGSKPVDLIAFRGRDIAIIECKNYENVNEGDIKILTKIRWQVHSSDIEFYLVKPTANGDIAFLIDVDGIVWRKFVDEVFT